MRYGLHDTATAGANASDSHLGELRVFCASYGAATMHMQRLFTYVNETGALAKLGQIEASPTEHESLGELFEKI